MTPVSSRTQLRLAQPSAVAHSSASFNLGHFKENDDEISHVFLDQTYAG